MSKKKMQRRIMDYSQQTKSDFNDTDGIKMSANMSDRLDESGRPEEMPAVREF